LARRQGEEKRMRIEPAGPEDAEEIYRLTNELEDELLPWDSFKEIYEGILSDRDEYIFVAREDVPVGYVHGRLTGELHHGGMISTVQEMIVGKAFRKKGIGRCLLQAAAGWSRERGAINMELTSNFSRAGAHAFYERIGFAKTSYKFVMELGSSAGNESSL